ncbi:hypothetical protein GALMADRAFT_234837 [Galerina marginata CBS 339.88]|uniref:Uncharacterized protein n=1 Tax=Galerina marginata (strain CBS 339.88) TaxID=685588 RepID=A0A067TRE3_GALM3|nr:hypothetical protein GALMADRAFT_234837 [Galerina marginata CBS 339.88]
MWKPPSRERSLGLRDNVMTVQSINGMGGIHHQLNLMLSSTCVLIFIGIIIIIRRPDGREGLGNV